jgi:pimeloyl-ACP methyl ester carboxylesterase
MPNKALELMGGTMFTKKKKVNLIIITTVLLIVFLIICLITGVFKPKESILDTRTIKGKIDIGGYGLNVDCYGKGKPTVIFESGLGNYSLSWELVQPEISKIARTFSYDRAGVGYSDSDGRDLPKTSLDQVHELHTLLEKANVKGPYIIVAHSIGGYNARLFAGTYPEEVSGIVFVDCTSSNKYDGFNKETSEYIAGLARLEPKLDVIESGNQVKEITKKDTLRNVPITVISAVNSSAEILGLSNKSKLVSSEGSGHYIQIEKEQIVIDAIKDLIKTVRKKF